MVAQRNIPRSSAAAAGAVLYPTTSHRPTSALRKDEHVLMSGAFSGPDLITGGSHAYHLNLRPSLCAAHCFFIILRPATLIFEVIPECIGYASRSSLAFLHCTQAASRCTALGTVCVWFKADTAAGARFLACSTSEYKVFQDHFSSAMRLGLAVVLTRSFATHAFSLDCQTPFRIFMMHVASFISYWSYIFPSMCDA